MPVDPEGLLGPTPGQARGPHWRRTSPRLYVRSSVDGDVVEQRIVEAAQRLPPDGAVSGWAALRLAGGGFFDGLERDGRTTRPVRLVVPRGRNLRPLALHVVGRERLHPSEVTVWHGVRCTRPLRAAFDEARSSADLREAVVAVDMALAAGLIELEDYREYARQRTGWVGAQQARVAGRLADPRSLSPAETRMRLIWTLDAGQPTPLCNWPIADLHGRRLGKPDLLSVEQGVYGEFDGADHRSRSRHRSDVAREQGFLNAGLEGFVVVGPDLDDTSLVVDRMLAAVRRAERRAGPREWMTARDPGPP